MSYLARTMKPALPLLFLLSVCACATVHPPLHFRDSPADYAQLGLGPTVEVKEDGRRSRPGTDDYEWWYLDGVSKDGTVVVVVFSDNWLPGNRDREVTIDITPPGKPTRSEAFNSVESGSFSRMQADVQIGHNRFQGALTRYTVSVDPTQHKGLGCELTLDRRAPSYRPGTGVMASGDDFFAWVVAVPEGPLVGTLTVDGKTVEFSGTGYHDHNWGNTPPWMLLRNWWWGRGAPGDQTVVMSEMRPAAGRGTKPLGLLYVATPGGVVVEAHGEATHLTEGPITSNEDTANPEPRASYVVLDSGSRKVSTRFTRRGIPLTSVDLLMRAPGLLRLAAHLTGRSPWYTRWSASVGVDAQGKQTAGDGTLEFMDFE